MGEEYKKGLRRADGEVVRIIKAMHEGVAREYGQFITDEDQLLRKLRTFWDYLEPTLGRKPWKKIHKAGNMRNYLSAIGELR